jgi:arginyl-tRNA synthetase
MVRAARDDRFGDYQANGVMAAAKQAGCNPRKLAEEVAGRVELDDICSKVEVAGPGFINLTVSDEYAGRGLLEIFADRERLGVARAERGERVVVDFSGPNIAKQMHVGHLRSTIIGDCICRLLEFLGHEVIRQNHIGDWGSQFGMLIAYLRWESPELLDEPEKIRIEDLEDFYKKAKAKYDSDEEFAKFSREQVVGLHNHESGTMLIWEKIVEQSRKHYLPLYGDDYLSVKLGREDERGESFYAGRLAGVVEMLKDKGIAELSEGAWCVFCEGFTNKDGERLPFIVQKSDGAFLYATTDLAALKFRVDELGADRVVYVTDARQKLHFEQLFATSRLAGIAGEGVDLVHIPFGTMLGADGKPFKTRSGESVKLKSLLDEAVVRARCVVEDKNPQLSEDEKNRVARAVGIGAVKYADYSNNRESDYVFSFDKMLAMDGNTAPYMQYAYARVRSIERKALKGSVDVAGELGGVEEVNICCDEERGLAKQLLRYGQAVEAAAGDYRSNYLTAYLYELSGKFNSFYAACPVLDAGSESRPTRLLLCDLTARTIKHGLSELLGIDVPEQM